MKSFLYLYLCNISCISFGEGGEDGDDSEDGANDDRKDGEDSVSGEDGLEGTVGLSFELSSVKLNMNRS